MHPDILWLEDDPFLLGLYIFRGELFKHPGGIKKNQRNKCSAIKVEWWNWKAKLIPTKKTKTRWWKAIWKTKLIPKKRQKQGNVTPDLRSSSGLFGARVVYQRWIKSKHSLSLQKESWRVALFKCTSWCCRQKASDGCWMLQRKFELVTSWEMYVLCIPVFIRTWVVHPC